MPGLRRAIERLRAAGYGVVIDDIQPTVPQLQALMELPFTGVKLDKDLVQLLADDAGLRDFTLGIVSSAKSRAKRRGSITGDSTSRGRKPRRRSASLDRSRASSAASRT